MRIVKLYYFVIFNICLSIFFFAGSVNATLIAGSPSIKEALPYTILGHWNIGDQNDLGGSDFEEFKRKFFFISSFITAQDIRREYQKKFSKKLTASMQFFCNDSSLCPKRMEISAVGLKINEDVSGYIAGCGSQEKNKIIFVVGTSQEDTRKYCEEQLAKQDIYVCKDSDNGRVYNMYGTVKGFESGNLNILEKSDRCFSSTQLIEEYCENNHIQSEDVTCPFACNEGRCVLESLTDKPDIILEKISFDPKEKRSGFLDIPSEIYFQIKNIGAHFDGYVQMFMTINDGIESSYSNGQHVSLYPNEIFTISSNFPVLTPEIRLGKNRLTFRVAAEQYDKLSNKDLQIDELNLANNSKVFQFENRGFDPSSMPEDPRARIKRIVNISFLVSEIVFFLFFIKYIVSVFLFFKDKIKRKKAIKRTLQIVGVGFFIFIAWTVVWYIITSSY